MAVHPGIIPGWPGYLGIPGYLATGGGVFGCPSWDNPGMDRGDIIYMAIPSQVSALLEMSELSAQCDVSSYAIQI